MPGRVLKELVPLEDQLSFPAFLPFEGVSDDPPIHPQLISISITSVYLSTIQVNTD